MRVFIDYCIKNPILTVILIAATVCMLIVSAAFLLIPNTEDEQEPSIPNDAAPNENTAEEADVISIPTPEVSNDTYTEDIAEEETAETDISETDISETDISETECETPFENEINEEKAEESCFLEEQPAVQTEETPIPEVKKTTKAPSTKAPSTKAKKTTKSAKSTKAKTKQENADVATDSVTEATNETDRTNETDNASAQPEEEIDVKAENAVSAVLPEKEEKPKKKASKTTKTTKTTGEKNKKTQKPPKSDLTTDMKEPIMLLDELKDVDNELDFYEEDETDRIARYKGKWVMCRVVTEERSASNVKSDEDEMYFFELHASNGEKLLSSEEYTSYNGALRGIETHRTNILRGNFKITISKKGEYIFKLLSGKNLLLCMGENYSTKAACESAIESTKRFAKTAIIDENIQDHVVKVPKEDDTTPLPLPDGYNGKWVIGERRGVDGEILYFFELFANNGEKLLSSEEYTTYIGAVNGIHTHKSNIEEGNFRVSLTKRGDYIYKLLNRNGQLLCLGEHYKTKRLCLNAVESVKRFAKQSPVLTSVKNKN